MKYQNYMYLWPPRPEVRVPKEAFQYYEQKGWWAQTKKNGTCTVIFTNGTDVIFKTRRYNEDHKMWTPQENEHFRPFRKTSDGLWNVFVAELLHNKTSHIKNHLYIFDLIVLNGEHLVGTTLSQRYGMLCDMFQTEVRQQYNDQLFVSDNISIGTFLKQGFTKRFETLQKEDEGLVIKDPNAKLQPCLKEGTNGAWQVKSRLPTKNYGY